jgi:hypothetical protein
MRVTLKYVDSYTVGPTSGAASNQRFNLNSLFDPDDTGSGHQPYRYDQLVDVYTRYRVFKTRYHIEFFSSADTYLCGVVPSNAALSSAVVGAATYNAACELPLAKCSGLGYGGCPNAKFSGTIALNLLGGNRMQEYSDDNRFQAVFNTSPAELLYLNVVYFNNSTGTESIHFQVQLFFEAELYDPAETAQSFSWFTNLKEGKPEFTIRHTPHFSTEADKLTFLKKFRNHSSDSLRAICKELES